MLIADGRLDTDEAAESLELRANTEYAQAVPADEILMDAFRARFSDDPQAFAAI